MLCWTKYKGYAYDVDNRDPNLCSIKSDASYDPTPIDNAMYICTDYGFMVQAQYCSEWSPLRYSTLVRFLCSKTIDNLLQRVGLDSNV